MTGFTLFYLINRRQARLPIELMVNFSVIKEKELSDALLERTFHIMKRMNKDLDKVRKRITEKQKAQKKRHDEKDVSEKLKISDKVLVEQTHLRNNMSAKLKSQ